MKKIIVLFCLIALTAIMLCSCKMGSCDICGESGFLTKRTVFGTDIYICSDCNN